MKRLRLLTLVLAALSLQSQAFGWSGPGHAAVAAMAYRELVVNPTLRDNLVNLLKSHPKFNVWKAQFEATKHNFPGEIDLGMFLFIRASTWPDEIRGTSIPALQHFDHPAWHFVDYPLNPPTFSTGPSPTPNDDILFGISESLKTLANKNSDPVERAASLSWLIHLVGDIHQPLHCATLITAALPAPEGDRGGNKFFIYQNSAQKKSHQKTKLHAYWDGRLGTDFVPDPVKALQDAKMLKTKHARTSLNELSAGDNDEQWSFESRDKSTTDVYVFHGTMLQPLKVIPSGYTTNSHNVARRRLALAGYRLADEMNKVVF
jgi:S1/P1 Nuclease